MTNFTVVMNFTSWPLQKTRFFCRICPNMSYVVWPMQGISSLKNGPVSIMDLQVCFQFRICVGSCLFILGHPVIFSQMIQDTSWWPRSPFFSGPIMVKRCSDVKHSPLQCQTFAKVQIHTSSYSRHTIWSIGLDLVEYVFSPMHSSVLPGIT